MSLTSSGLKSADAAIYAAECKLHGLFVLTDGTNAATVVLYDNASAASGTELAKYVVPGASLSGYVHFDCPVGASKGIYADVSGTGANYIVHYAIG